MVLKHHSYDEKKMRRYLLADRIKGGDYIMNIRSAQDYGSYAYAVNRGVIHEPDGTNNLWVRLDPATAGMVSSWRSGRQDARYR